MQWTPLKSVILSPNVPLVPLQPYGHHLKREQSANYLEIEITAEGITHNKRSGL